MLEYKTWGQWNIAIIIFRILWWEFIKRNKRDKLRIKSNKLLSESKSLVAFSLIGYLTKHYIG